MLLLLSIQKIKQLLPPTSRITKAQRLRLANVHPNPAHQRIIVRICPTDNSLTHSQSSFLLLVATLPTIAFHYGLGMEDWLFLSTW
jgi:hypothetical protein